MEVHRGTRKHEYPNHYECVQSDVQQLDDCSGQGGQTGGLHVSHGCRLLHDEERGVEEQEGVTRDVEAMPVKAGPHTGGLCHEVCVANVQSSRGKTRAGDIFYVEECLSADKPAGGCCDQ